MGRPLQARVEMQLGPALRNAPYRPWRLRNEVPAVPGARVVALETGQTPPPPAPSAQACSGCHGCWRRGGAEPEATPYPHVAPPPLPPARPPCRPRCCCRGSCPGVRGAVAGAAEVRLGAEARGQCQAQAKKGWAVLSGCGAEAHYGRLGPHLPTASASLGEPAPRTGGRAAQPPGEALRWIRLVPMPRCGIHPAPHLPLLCSAAAS